MDQSRLTATASNRVRPVLAAFLQGERVAKAGGGQKGGARGPLGDDRVSGACGAVDQAVAARQQGVCGLAERIRNHRQRGLHAGENPVRRGQGLADVETPGCVDHDDVSEGAARVDGYLQAHR
jgi:hypothetical protein